MDRGSQNSGLFFYVPMILLGIVLLVIVFSWQYRSGVETGGALPPPVKETAGTVIDHRALAKQTDLAADGKMLFQINCASCHGVEGNGDGPRSAGLNPPPRKYKTEKFKFGTDVASIQNTLMQGSPGTSMPSFSLLPARDVWAMVHYVRTMIPNPDPTTDAVMARLPEAPKSGTASAPVASAAAEPASNEGRIPITLAMSRLEKPAPAPASLPTPSNHPAKQLYANRCASCHGINGEGASANVLAVDPYRYTKTASLYNPYASWRQDRAVFDNLILHGLPGRVHPGHAALSRKQLDELYDFVVNYLSPIQRAAISG
jgi:mono/diheme cytochrome c family protein